MKNIELSAWVGGRKKVIGSNIFVDYLVHKININSKSLLKSLVAYFTVKYGKYM